MIVYHLLEVPVSVKINHMAYSHRCAVDIILLNSKKEVLLSMLNSNVGKNKWSFIGGRVEKDETFLQAVQREVREELGEKANVEITDKVCAVRDNSIPPYYRPHLTIILLAKYIDGQIENAEPESNIELKWFPLDDLPTNLF